MKLLKIFLILLFLNGCQKQSNNLYITLSRSEFSGKVNAKLFRLEIKGSDSLVYKNKIPLNFSSDDTLKLTGLADGNYKIQYDDILGDTKIKTITLNGNTQRLVQIVPDIISTKKFNNTPIFTLKNGEHYTVEMSGGCIASLYGYYKISKHNDKLYLDNFNIKKRVLSTIEVQAIQKFERELLAIQNAKICSSTGAMTFKIITYDLEKTIRDDTCMWNGWENLMSKLK